MNLFCSVRVDIDFGIHLRGQLGLGESCHTGGQTAEAGAQTPDRVLATGGTPCGIRCAQACPTSSTCGARLRKTTGRHAGSGGTCWSSGWGGRGCSTHTRECASECRHLRDRCIDLEVHLILRPTIIASPSNDAFGSRQNLTNGCHLRCSERSDLSVRMQGSVQIDGGTRAVIGKSRGVVAIGAILADETRAKEKRRQI